MEKSAKWLNFRINLPYEYEAGSLFQEQKTRQELLKNIFHKNIFCEHAGQNLQYFYESHKDNIIIGRLLLEREIKYNQKSKEEPHERPVISPDWHGVWFVLNTSPNFQTISITKNKDFRDIFPKLKSLSKFLTELFKKEKEGYGCIILPIFTSQTFWEAITGAQVYKLSVAAHSENFLEGNPHKTSKNAFKSFNSRKYTQIFENDEEALTIEQKNEDINELVNLTAEGVLELKVQGIKSSSDTKSNILFNSVDEDDKHTLSLECPQFTYKLSTDTNSIKEARAIIENNVIPKLLKLPNKINEE